MLNQKNPNEEKIEIKIDKKIEMMMIEMMMMMIDKIVINMNLTQHDLKDREEKRVNK